MLGNRGVVVFFACFALSACADGELNGTDIAAETTSIQAASRAFSDAYVRGDTSAIGDLYTDGAVLLPPGRRIEGRDAIKAYFAPSAIAGICRTR